MTDADDTLSLREAARFAGVPRTTLARHLADGRVPGAHLDGDRWSIPRAALVAAGYDELVASWTGARTDADMAAKLAAADERVAELEEAVECLNVDMLAAEREAETENSLREQAEDLAAEHRVAAEKAAAAQRQAEKEAAEAARVARVEVAAANSVAEAAQREAAAHLAALDLAVANLADLRHALGNAERRVAELENRPRRRVVELGAGGVVEASTDTVPPAEGASTAAQADEGTAKRRRWFRRT